MVLPSLLIASWQRELAARNLSPRTLHNYGDTVTKFSRWCEDNARSADPAKQKPGDVVAWLAELLETGTASSSTATHFRNLQQWFRWLESEEEIERNPMARLKPPKIDETPPEVLTDAQLTALLEQCKGVHWMDRRDTAIMRLLLDTGMRVAELVGMTVDDIDFDNGLARVIGKGRRERFAPFGKKTALALDRYLRARTKRPQADLPALWLSRRGPLGDEAVRVMLRKRGDDAGVPGVHPHLFRHTMAHTWLHMGGQEQDLMEIAGWRSRQMLGRYGKSAAAKRAAEAHKRLAPGDRV
jgi:site-specific recombinase XerD